MFIFLISRQKLKTGLISLLKGSVATPSPTIEKEAHRAALSPPTWPNPRRRSTEIVFEAGLLESYKSIVAQISRFLHENGTY
ncbi:MAG: hypothetical protein E5V78_14575 [Mesorhizobium sp.]|nr:MAG: hypothetical protein E5V78_14575 [Mesorhizobium sp.]